MVGVTGTSGAFQTHPRGDDGREHQPAYHSVHPKHPPQPLSQTLVGEPLPQLPLVNRTDYFAPTWNFPPPESGFSSARSASSVTPANHNSLTNARENSDITLAPSSTSPETRNPRLPQPPVIYGVTDDDEFMDENEVSAWVAQLNEDEARRLSATLSTSKLATRRKSSVILPRNRSITAPFASLDDFDHDGVRLFPRVYVELKDGDFMKIVHIVKDTRTSEITLRGFIFRRTREMNGVLDRKLNEVCWIIHVDDDDSRDHNIQGLETVSVTEVVKRRKIRMTNLSFPALSFRDDKHKDTEETVENDRVLVCRYKYLCFYPNAKARNLNAWCEKGFHRLRADDCDKRSDNNINDEDLRTIWRGETSPGGAQEGWMPGEKEFLRQEAVSNKGIISWQSLKIPGGTDFPPGDPMKRGGVGTLFRKMTSSAASSANTAPNPAMNSDESPDASLVVASDADDEVEEVASSPFSSTRVQQQRSHRRKPRIPLAILDDRLDPSDCDSDECPGMMHDLNRRLRESSIQAQRLGRTSPRVIEFNAQVKTTSRSGIYEKRYEGKVTETYIPKPGSLNKKRKAEHSFGSPVGPRKRVDVRLRNYPDHRTMIGAREDPIARYRSRSSLYKTYRVSPSDSDRTLGSSQSEDSVEELCTPTRARCYGNARSGLSTTLSLRKNGSMRPMSPSNTDLVLPFRTPRPSTLSFDHGRLIVGDEDDVVDLTRPRPHQRLAFSTPFPRSSKSRQPVTCASSQSRPDHPTNAYETSSSPYASSHPRLSYNGLSSYDQRRSPPARLPRPISSSGSLVKSYRHSPRARGLPARLSSKGTDGPQVQSQSTALPQGLVKQECQKSSKEFQRRYTFGDCFCGAGGMSRGAINAGLRIKWGFDFNLSACQTYALNFIGTSIYNVWANDFSEAKGDHRVDICHLSPPCQYFSDAHTWEGKDDEMNTASLFAIFNLLEKAKPRVVTLEQTSGLIRRHPIFFNAVINMFTSRGFSVRWRVLNCADFGLPQRRMRLFVIASW